MKRFLAIVLSALLVLTTLAFPVMAEDELLIEVIGEDMVEEEALEEEGDENDLVTAEVTEEPEDGQIDEIEEIDENDEIEEEMSMDPDDSEDGSEESDISLEESQGEWEELLEEQQVGDSPQLEEELDPVSTELLMADEGIPYLHRSWDGSKVVEATGYFTNYSVVNSSTEYLDGLYVVNSWVNLDERCVVTGNAAILLCNGAGLYIKEGIHVPAGKTLNIFGQPGDTGVLHCDAADNDDAAIGSNDESGDCGTVNIYGGTVLADTKKLGTNGAGIGGGDEGNGGIVTIYGGSVTAIGGSYGAGIGGGDADGNGGNGGTTTIYGGTVNAYGGSDAAGIGGGEDGSGGTITIYGGTVNAFGGVNAAGIGGGEDGGSGIINIYGGTVSATGGSEYYNGGAGIGGGNEGTTWDIGIHGGNVTATGGARGAGIGGGDHSGGNGHDHGDSGTIIIDGGTVKAQGGNFAAGIGGGNGGGGGTITIDNGDITASGGMYGAGIGGGDENVFQKISIRGGTVNANGGEGAAGIGSGRNYLYSEEGEIIISGGTVKAYGGGTGIPGGAGIGRGSDTAGGKITISGGTILGVGAWGSAGIGGGSNGEGGTILISGGNVQAAGGDNAAGIGSGKDKAASTASITLTYTDAVRITSTQYNGRVTLEKSFYDGDNVWPARLYDDTSVLAGKTLKEYFPRSYIDENGKEQSVKYVPLITADTRELNEGWYRVHGDVTNHNRLIANVGSGSGGVHIILEDGANFTNPKGITVDKDKSLIVYGQKEGTGTWKIDSPDSNDAGIGGSGADSGDIIIGGGTISVRGGVNGGAGIGGGKGGSGTVMINGGAIKASGGGDGAAIGGGEKGSGTVTITGGTVEADGGFNGGSVSLGIIGCGSDADPSSSSITLTYTDFVSVRADDGYRGRVTLQKTFSDGNDVYEAGDYDDASAFKGKILRPYIAGQQGGYTPEKAANTLTISPKKKTVKRAGLTKAKRFKITAKNAKGKVTYTALKKAKKAGIKVTKKGKVTIPKNCRKGTYKIKVRAAGNKNYKAKTLYTVITVK